MRPIYEQKRVPLQFRRLIIFNEICRKAKKHPETIVHLTSQSQLALGVMYLQESKSYIAFGGVFEYIDTSNESVDQHVNFLDHDDTNMYEIVIKRRAFTKPVRTPITLLWHWNNYVKNQFHTYVHQHRNQFIQVESETELDCQPNRANGCLLATLYLPLWNNMK